MRFCNIAVESVENRFCVFYHPRSNLFRKQIKVAASCVNTDFWLDKITQESRYTLDLRHFVKNKFALGR